MKNLWIMIFGLSLCIMLPCCGNDQSTNEPKETSQDVQVRVVSNENIELKDNSMTIIDVYGFDDSLDNISASQLVRQVAAATLTEQLPIETDIELPEDPASNVCLTNEQCQPMYYLQVLVDVDGDGQICPGDLVPDYGSAPWKTYSLEEMTSQQNEIQVKVKTGDPSDCILPSEYYRELDGLYRLPVRLVVNDFIEFSPGSLGQITFYGFDDGLTERSAIPIVTNTFIPSDRSLELDITLLEEPAPYVCKDNYPCSDRYSFVANIDVDGDGQICPGDLIQDFDMNPFESYTLDELKNQGGEIHMKLKTGEPSDCISISDVVTQTPF